MIKKNIFYLFIFIFFLNFTAEGKIIIVKRVNNQIITNLDVDVEEKYLKTLKCFPKHKYPNHLNHFLILKYLSSISKLITLLTLKIHLY